MDGRRQGVRLALAGAAALMLAGTVAGTALAVRPDRIMLPAPDLVVDESCGYRIDVTFPRNLEFGLFFVDQEGESTRFILAGPFVATMTNAGTGESLTVNISGGQQVSFVRETSQMTGRWALWPDGTLTILAGRTDGEGTFHGRVVLSVCEALAP